MAAHLTAPLALIADSEPYIRRVLEAKLSKDNRFQVVSAATGEDALQAAVERSFDVLLWDMRLRDAGEMLPRLRALCPHAALFLMTTDDRPMLDADSACLDVTGTLVKPFGLDTLVEQLQRGIANSRSLPAAVCIELSRIGQMVTLVSSGGTCVARVLEKTQDTFTIVGAPRVETPPDFAEGLRVRAWIKGEDALYSFHTRLLRFHTSPLPSWELSLPQVIRREQRRKYPRQTLQLPVLLKSEEAQAVVSVPNAYESGLSFPDSRSMKELRGAVGVTEDISLGGCVLVSDRALPVGAEVTFDLQQGGAPQEEVEGHGRIVRSDLLAAPEVPSPNEPLRYRLAVQFTRLESATRRRLRSLLMRADG